MEPARKKEQVVWLPFVVLGYLETLRRATFYSFGWAGSGMALGIIGSIVAAQITINYYYPTKVKRFLINAAALTYIVSVWVANNLDDPGQTSFLRDIFFGIPNFGLESMSSIQYANFAAVVVFFYALVVYMLTGFIVERKSVIELFTAGVILLGVETVASDQGIMGYAVLNIIFSIVLRCQTSLLRLEDDDRVRFPGGTGLKVNSWVGLSLVLAVIITTVAAFLPAVKTKIDLTSSGGKWAKNVVSRGFLNSEKPEGAVDSFWGKLQNFELKGGVPIDDKPVMYVKSPQPGYWRGESCDYYTGTGWQTTASPRDTNVKEFSNPYSRNVAVNEVEQAFLLAPAMSSQVIFYAGFPASVEMQKGKLTIDDGDNLYTDNVNLGITYKVVSFIPEINQGKLKRTSQEYPFEIRQKYLQLPGSMPARVGILAQKLTRNATNPYDRVKAVEEYLSSGYPYDLTISSGPKNRDVVDYFLFDLKRGYCTYHSTAMVVMLRSIGIPARWVKGFTSGTFNPEKEVYEVLMSNSHAWVEVYFSDYGWLPFEPTPSFILPGGVPPSSQAAVFKETPVEAPAKPVPAASPNIILQEQETGLPWGRITAVLLAMAGAAAYYLWRTKNIFKIGSGDKMRDTYLAFINLLAVKGYPKNEAQTPFEFAKSLADKFPDDYQDIISITDAYLADKYGRKKLAKQELQKVYDIWKRLAEKWLGKSRD